MGLTQFQVNELRDDKPTRSHERAFTLDKAGAIPLKVILRFFWSTRSNATPTGGWFVDVKDADGEPIVVGLGVVVSANIFDGYR